MSIDLIYFLKQTSIITESYTKEKYVQFIHSNNKIPSKFVFALSKEY